MLLSCSEKIEDLRRDLESPLHVISQKFETLRSNFYMPLIYMNVFHLFVDSLSKINPPTNESLDQMSNSLSFDVACFKQELPVHFKSFEAWKDFEACRMLTEMEIERVDTYVIVKKLYRKYKHKGRLDLMKKEPCYETVAIFAALMERIASFEYRLDAFEDART